MKRAEERKEYERRKAEVEAESREIREEMRKRQAAEERKQLIKERQETIIKPAPIKQYKPIQIHKSEKEPTQPRTPKFSKR